MDDENDTSVLDGLDSDASNDGNPAGEREQAELDSTALVKCDDTQKRKRITELTEEEINFNPEDCDDYQCPFCDHR